ncbi:hypothetical protein JTB14_000230 [Gonioctena quinquepunctata]|nr:hypothetical protein JTB14_000230 [Gonioctena quinquepunctata]
MKFLIIWLAFAPILSVLGEVLDCTKPNEQYECGSACQTECKNLGQACPIVNVRCNDACYCVSGYARDENEDCIPISECNSHLLY